MVKVTPYTGLKSPHNLKTCPKKTGLFIIQLEVNKCCAKWQDNTHIQYQQKSTTNDPPGPESLHSFKNRLFRPIVTKNKITNLPIENYVIF